MDGEGERVEEFFLGHLAGVEFLFVFGEFADEGENGGDVGLGGVADCVVRRGGCGGRHDGWACG